MGFFLKSACSPGTGISNRLQAETLSELTQAGEGDVELRLP